MPKERNKADNYREKAYQGDTKAMNNLGVCYERGIGVKVSLELAFEWYMKAVELDDVYCFYVSAPRTYVSAPETHVSAPETYVPRPKT